MTATFEPIECANLVCGNQSTQGGFVMKTIDTPTGRMLIAMCRPCATVHEAASNYASGNIPPMPIAGADQT